MNSNLTESRKSQALGCRVDLFRSDRCAAALKGWCYNDGVREVRLVESEVLTNLKSWHSILHFSRTPPSHNTQSYREERQQIINFSSSQSFHEYFPPVDTAIANRSSDNYRSGTATWSLHEARPITATQMSKMPLFVSHCNVWEGLFRAVSPHDCPRELHSFQASVQESILTATEKVPPSSLFSLATS